VQLVALVLVLAVSASARADDLETLRVVDVRAPRGQLERAASALTLVNQLVEDGAWETLRSGLMQRPEGVLLLMFLSSNQPRSAGVDLAIGAGGGTDGGVGAGDVTATLTARVSGDYCDLVAASVSVRGGFAAQGEGAIGEARAGAGLCFWRGLFAPVDSKRPQLGAMSLLPLRMRAGLAVNATPRFTAPRSDPRRTYSEATVGVATEGIRWMRSDPSHGIGFMYLDLEERWEWPGAFEGDHGYETIAGFGFVRLFRTRSPLALADRAIDIFDIQLHGVRFDDAVALIEARPVVIRGLGLGSDRVLLDLDAGVGASGGTIQTSNCLDDVGCTDETIMRGDDVADVTTWVGNGALTLGTQVDGGGVRFARTLDSNLLAQLAVENRATAWYQRQRASQIVRAELFGGTARHYLGVDVRGDERFAGASVDVQVEVGPRLWAGAQLDGIYAFARDPVLAGRVAGTGVRAFATLAWTLDLAHRDIHVKVPTMEELDRQLKATEPAASP
jgi:hypothetical protein